MLALLLVAAPLLLLRPVSAREEPLMATGVSRAATAAKQEVSDGSPASVEGAPLPAHPDTTVLRLQPGNVITIKAVVE